MITGEHFAHCKTIGGPKLARWIASWRMHGTYKPGSPRWFERRHTLEHSPLGRATRTDLPDQTYVVPNEKICRTPRSILLGNSLQDQYRLGFLQKCEHCFSSFSVYEEQDITLAASILVTSLTCTKSQMYSEYLLWQYRSDGGVFQSSSLYDERDESTFLHTCRLRMVYCWVRDVNFNVPLTSWHRNIIIKMQNDSNKMLHYVNLQNCKPSSSTESRSMLQSPTNTVFDLHWSTKMDCLFVVVVSGKRLGETEHKGWWFVRPQQSICYGGS